jgi:hypothetical protein
MIVHVPRARMNLNHVLEPPPPVSWSATRKVNCLERCPRLRRAWRLSCWAAGGAYCIARCTSAVTSGSDPSRPTLPRTVAACRGRDLAPIVVLFESALSTGTARPAVTEPRVSLRRRNQAALSFCRGSLCGRRTAPLRARSWLADLARARETRATLLRRVPIADVALAGMRISSSFAARIGRRVAQGG